MIGIFILVVWTTAEWASIRRGWETYAAGVGILVLIGFSIATRAQLKYWHDDESLWAHALEVTRDNCVAENNFGVVLMKQNRRDEAVAHFRTAEAIEPKDPTSQLNLGVYAQEQGDLRQAAARYEWVLQLATDTQLRGTAYANLGPIYFGFHDYPRAQRSIESAMQLHRIYPRFFLYLGLIAEKNGDWKAAAQHFASLAGAEPTDVAYLLLSRALAQDGDSARAGRAEQLARQISTDFQKTQQTPTS